MRITGDTAVARKCTKFTRYKNHTCNMLSLGDLVMVWDNDMGIEDAVNRKFHLVTADGLVVVQDPTDKDSLNVYRNGLPHVDWVTKVLQN